LGFFDFFDAAVALSAGLLDIFPFSMMQVWMCIWNGEFLTVTAMHLKNKGTQE
jgi:cytosine/uracil/thiamine/allantoin permease